MANTENESTILIKKSLNVAVVDDVESPIVGDILSLHGFESVTFIFRSGDVTDGAFRGRLYHSDVSDFSVCVLVPDSELSMPQADITFDNTKSQYVYQVGYYGYKPYIRAYIIGEGVLITGGVFSGEVILGDPRTAPTT